MDNVALLESKRILLFEDKDTVIDSVSNMVQEHGGHLEAYRTPERLPIYALQEYDAVVLDISFKDRSGADIGSNGIDQLKYIRSISTDLPIIMFSVEDSQVIIDAAYQLGATAYVVKYQSDFTLINVIDNALNHNVVELDSYRDRLLNLRKTPSPAKPQKNPIDFEPYKSIIEGLSHKHKLEKIAAAQNLKIRPTLLFLQKIKMMYADQVSKEVIEYAKSVVDENESKF